MSCSLQNVRGQLEESLPGTGGGKNPNDKLLVKFLFLFPFCTLLFCYHRSSLQTGSSLRRTSLFNQIRHLYYIIRSSGTVAYTGVSSSPTINANSQFPNGAQTRCLPTWEEFQFLTFLHLIYEWGSRAATQLGSVSSHMDSLDSDSRKGHQRQAFSCDIVTWYYGLGMAFLAIAAPSLPCILGITALFLRLGLTVFGGIMLASSMTYGSEHLAIMSFSKGLEEQDSTRSRSACFLC